MPKRQFRVGRKVRIVSVTGELTKSCMTGLDIGDVLVIRANDGGDSVECSISTSTTFYFWINKKDLIVL